MPAMKEFHFTFDVLCSDLLFFMQHIDMPAFNTQLHLCVLLMVCYSLFQARRLNKGGYHFLIMGFKANQKKHSLLTFTTDGIAASFMTDYPKVKLLWEAYCKKEISR